MLRSPPRRALSQHATGSRPLSHPTIGKESKTSISNDRAEKERKEGKENNNLFDVLLERNEREWSYIYGINFEPNPGLWHLCEVGSKLTANSKNSNSTSMFPRQMYHTTKSSKVKKQIFVLKALC